LFPGEEPIGKEFRFTDPDASSIAVVGIVEDVHTVDLSSSSPGQVYLPYAQNPWPNWMYMVVRSSHQQSNIAEQLREILRMINPNIPFDGIHPLSDRLSNSIILPRFNAFLLAIFSVAALMLAAIGIYATLTNWVNLRTREIGIRIALGASPSRVKSLVVREGMQLVAIGIIIGLGTTILLSTILSSFLFEVTATDPSTLATVSILFAFVSLAACYLPAHSATRNDPLPALRGD
jgi:putative ABC transport system permease protein